MACQLDLLFDWRSVELGMNVLAAQLFIPFLLDHERVRFGVSILAHAGNLPGNFHVGHTGFDLELVVFDLARYDGLRELSDHGQLIAEVGVESLKPVRQRHRRLALRIGDDDAVVNVLHLRRFHRGMDQVLVDRIQRMIDFEVLCSPTNGAPSRTGCR